MENEGYQLANTLITAYAAIVATISLIASGILGYLELKRRRPHLKVTATYGVLEEFGRGNSEPLIFLQAINDGAGPVSITGVGWLLKDGRKIQYTSPPNLSLNHVLPERRSATTYIPCRKYNQDNNRNLYKHPFFQDEMGAIWKGKVTRTERKLWESAPSTGWKLY